MGETPLHYAVRLGREDLVNILLKAGADITIRGVKEVLNHNPIVDIIRIKLLMKLLCNKN
jgi:ankyrin repeat protein